MTDISRPRSLASLRESYRRWHGLAVRHPSDGLAAWIRDDLARQIAEHPDNEKE